MKRKLFYYTLLWGALLFLSCTSKNGNQNSTAKKENIIEQIMPKKKNIDEKLCEKLILTHPFFKQRHVLPSQKELVGCNKDLAGIKENASWTGRGFTTAYYYYLYGFGIQNVREIEKLENRAICKFDLIEKDKTKAYQYFNEHDYNPDRIEGKSAACQALFVKYEKEGWKLERIACNEYLFMINIWENNQYRGYINFDSFKF